VPHAEGRLDDGDDWRTLGSEGADRVGGRLRHDQRVEVQAGHGLKVGLPVRRPDAVHTHGHEAPAGSAAQDACRHRTGGILLPGRHRILEVGHHRVGARGERLLQLPLLVSGREEQGAGRCERHRS
jgi:hypothetical protein